MRVPSELREAVLLVAVTLGLSTAGVGLAVLVATLIA